MSPRTRELNPWVDAACEVDFSDDAILLRCSECVWSGPVTRFAAGIDAHAHDKHKRQPTALELVPRTAAQRDVDNEPAEPRPVDESGEPRPKYFVAGRRGSPSIGSSLLGDGS